MHRDANVCWRKRETCGFWNVIALVEVTTDLPQDEWLVSVFPSYHLLIDLFLGADWHSQALSSTDSPALDVRQSPWQGPDGLRHQGAYRQGRGADDLAKCVVPFGSSLDLVEQTCLPCCMGCVKKTQVGQIPGRLGGFGTSKKHLQKL